MSVSIDQLLDSISSLGLVSTDEVAQWRNSLEASQQTADAEAFIKDLVRQGRLTRYQAINLYAGRGRGLVFGEYLVLDNLGAGGMGQVYKAQHRRMKRTVALKVLPAHLTSTKANVDRFYQEVQVAARLIHPNIVTAFDSGEAHGLHFLVMEYVEGSDLGAILAKQGALTVDQAMNCISQAAEGLAYAHAQGIVHRDIKPSNLLIDRQARVKILDMGLARLLGEADRHDAAANQGLTQDGQVMGTIDYMAPEQAHDTRSADYRADIYSLGCTLYRLVTGEVPYPADTVVKKILSHRELPIPSLRAKRPEAPAKLDELFQRMLAKQPEQRLQNVREVAQTLQLLLKGVSDEASSVHVLNESPQDDDLQSFLRSQKQIAGSTIGGAAGSSIKTQAAKLTEPSSPTGPLTEIGRAPAKSRLPLVAVAGGLVVLLAVGGWWVLRDRPSPIVAEELPPAAPVVPASAPPPPKSLVVPTTPKSAPKTLPSTTVAKATPAIIPEKPAPPLPEKPAPAPQPTSPSPAPPSATSIAVAPQEPTDLLARIDLKRDTLRDVWKLENGALITPATNSHPGGIQLPVVPGNTYRLRMTVVTPQTYDNVQFGIVFPLDKLEQYLLFHYQRVSTFHKEDLYLPENQFATAARNPLIAQGKHELVFDVGPDRWALRVDGVLVGFWQGDTAKLTQMNYGALPQRKNDERRLVLTSHGASWHLTRIEYAPLKVEEIQLEDAHVPRNLLAGVDLKRDAVQSEWQRQGDRLRGTFADRAQSALILPGAIPERFELTALVERQAAVPFELDIPIRGRRLTLLTDFPYNEPPLFATGVPNGQGSVGGSGDTLFSKNPVLVLPGRWNQLQWRFDHDGLHCTINGRRILHWKYSVHTPNVGARSLEQLSKRLTDASLKGGFDLARITTRPLNWQPRTVPSTSDLAQAQKKIRSANAPSYDKTATPELKQIAAQGLLRAAALEQQDPALHFAQLDAALTLAAEGGDLWTALTTVEDITVVYQVDARDYEKRLVTTAFKAPRPAAQKQPLAETALRLLDPIVLSERFDLAAELLAAVQAAGVKLSPDVIKELRTRAVEYKQWIAEAATARQAREQLAQDSTNAAAHDALGRYLGLVAMQWHDAADHLSQGKDTAWREIAEGEVRNPTAPAEQAALGDRWWALAEKATGALKGCYQERADIWYRRATPGLSGAIKTVVDKRRDQLNNLRKTTGAAFAQRHPWDAVKIGDHWYQYFHGRYYWESAQHICDRLGGSLAIIETAAENQAVGQLALTEVKRLTGEEKAQVFFGGSDMETEGTFRWVNGQPVAGGFTAWQPGEPDNRDGREDAMYLYLYFTNNKLNVMWGDVNALGGLSGFVCEWEW